MFESTYKKMLITIFLSISSYAYAGKDQNKCDSNSVMSQTNCIKKENFSLQSQLNLQKNKQQNDYSKWLGNLKNKCEGKVNYSSGEGVWLIKEQCYNDEYKYRIKYLNDKVKQKQKNSDGLEITNLPYNSQDHLKCLKYNSKNSCQKINLISATKIIQIYNFVNPQYGNGVVLPESNDGKLIVISPFSDEGETLLNINIVDKFGVVKEKTLSEESKFTIDESYNLTYLKNGKSIKEKL